VTGRVTDRATGKPIKGHVRYGTLAGNRHLADLPGKDIHRHGNMTYDLDAQGRFRLVAPPGLGILLVQVTPQPGDQPYPPAPIPPEDRNTPALRDGGQLGAHFVTSAGIIQMLAGFHAYRLLEPAEGAEKMTADLQLDPGRAVAGQVVGPDGKPFPGATAAGLTSVYAVSAALPGAGFTAEALLPGEARTVAFVHPGKQLAGTVVVRDKDRETP